ncbi:MAG: hypothetical protein V4489_05260 [Chlamydiota bacterium]
MKSIENRTAALNKLPPSENKPFSLASRIFGIEKKNLKDSSNPTNIESNIITLITKHPEAALLLIKSSCISSSFLREKFAWALLKSSPLLLLKNIKIFKIENKKVLQDIFTTAMNDITSSSFRWREGCLINNLKDFEITDLKVLTRIVILTAEYEPRSLPLLGISDPKVLEQAARNLSLNKNPKTSLLEEIDKECRVIQFLIKKNEALMEEIILNIIKNDEPSLSNRGSFTVDYLLRITKIIPILTQKPEFLEKVALLASEKAYPDLLPNLKEKFLVTDEEILKKIISNLAGGELTKPSFELHGFIKTMNDLGIQDLPFCEEISLSLLKSKKNDSYLLTEILESFSTISPDFLTKINLAIDDWETRKSSRLESLDITIQEGPNKKFIDLILSYNRFILIKHSPKLHLIPEKLREEISLISLKDFPRDLPNLAECFIDSNSEFLEKIEADSKLLEANIANPLIKNPKVVKWLGLALAKKEPRLFLAFIEGRFLPKALLLSILTEYEKWLHAEKGCTIADQEIARIFLEIVNYRNTPIADALLQTFMKNISSSDYQAVYSEYTLTKKQKNPISIHKILPAIFLSKWHSDVEKDPSLQIRNREAKQILLAFLQSSDIRSALRKQEGGDLLMQNYLFTVIALDKDTSLKSIEKLELLAKFCNLELDKPPTSREIATGLSLVRILSEKNMGSILNYNFTKPPLEESKSALDQMFLKTSYATLEGLDHPWEKYEKTFKEAPIPVGALLTFEVSLQAHHTKALQQDHTRFVRSVLGNTAQKERNRIDINSNLEHIALFKEIFQKWQESLKEIVLYFTNEKALNSELEFIIKDIDKALLLWIIPTLVSGTCLNITGVYSRCLLAYPMDGSVRMITVQDRSDTFLARSVLRIILDSDLKPVLLLEPIYVNPKLTDNRVKREIIQMAFKKAEYLGIKLFMPAYKPPPYYTGSFTWLGSSCALSYSDIMGGVLPNAKTEFSMLNLQEVKKEDVSQISDTP